MMYSSGGGRWHGTAARELRFNLLVCARCEMTIPGSTSLEFKGIRVQVRTELAVDAVVARLQSVTKSGTVADIIRLSRAARDEAAFADEVNKQYIGSSGFMTFATIDHGSWITRYGIKRQVLRWILGNPLIAITMMKDDITAG